MLLSNNELEQELDNKKIIYSKKNDGSKVSLGKSQPASINLTVGRIFEPLEGSKVRKDNEVEGLSLDRHSIGPGEMTVIEVKEHFDMPTSFGGVIFLPNRMAKEGLLMTNPGHIDPGFQGLITVCLVNMGKQPVVLKQGQTIARLLVFKTTSQATGFDGSVSKGVDKHQLNSLDKDFAGLNKRLPKEINKYMTIRAGGAIAVIGLTLALFAFFIPELGKYRVEAATKKQLTTEMFVPFREEVLAEVSELHKKQEEQLNLLRATIVSLCKNDQENELCKTLDSQLRN